MSLMFSSPPYFQESQVSTYTPSMFYREGDILTPQQHNQTLQYLSQARIRIVEQPASKQLRFRYESEIRSVGCIRGAKSTPKNKTFPTISVDGYQGKAMVVVSCVTKDRPYRAHPFKLVSKGTEDNGNGIISLNDVSINGTDSLITFQNVGIKCVKRANMAESLSHRESLGVDPFSTGFSHKYRPNSIDLNVVRLCFEVFLEGDVPGKFVVKIPPMVSNPIFNLKETSTLSIVQLSDCTSSVEGGKKIILLCEKVMKEDIKVRFFEKDSGWEAFADIQPTQIHKQVAIWFFTPRYKAIDVTNAVKVFIQLLRPSDGATGEPLPFEFLPKQPDRLPRSKRKIENADEFMRRFQRCVGGSNNFNISGEAVKVDAAVTGSNNLNISGGTVKEDPAASFPQCAGIGAYKAVTDIYCPNIWNPPLEMPTLLDNRSNYVNSDELENLVKELDQESPLVDLDNSLFVLNIDSTTDMLNFKLNDFTDL